MHFVGPVCDAQRADRGKQFGQRNIVGNAGASVHLNRLVDNLQRRMASCACFSVMPRGASMSATLLSARTAEGPPGEAQPRIDILGKHTS